MKKKREKNNVATNYKKKGMYNTTFADEKKTVIALKYFS